MKNILLNFYTQLKNSGNKSLTMKKTLLLSFLLIAQFTFLQTTQTIYKKLKNNQIKSKFHAMGSEPYWDLYFMDNYAIFADDMNSICVSLKFETTFDEKKNKQQIKLRTPNNKIVTVTITKERYMDEGENYSKYTVNFGNNGELPSGALYDYDVFLFGGGN